MNNEIFHKGKCQIVQSSFTKICKRFIADVEAVYGSSPYPDELQRAIEALKKGETYSEDPYQNTWQFWFKEKDCVVKYIHEFHISLAHEVDERTLKPVYVFDWWLFERVYYEKHFAGQKIVAEDYEQLDAKTNALKGKHRYYCNHRPPAKGCIPDDFVTIQRYHDYPKYNNHVGEASYNRELSVEECRQWGLEPVVK